MSEPGRAAEQEGTGRNFTKPQIMRGSLWLLAAILFFAGVHGSDEGGADGEPVPSEARAGPQPVAQMTLMLSGGSQGQEQRPVVAAVMPDEDAAAAAVRFCFEYGLTEPPQVIDIAGYLKGSLADKNHEPDNIELLRTAGAYSRRAAESSKEENYAEAAAGSVVHAVVAHLLPAARYCV